MRRSDTICVYPGVTPPGGRPAREKRHGAGVPPSLSSSFPRVLGAGGALLLPPLCRSYLVPVGGCGQRRTLCGRPPRLPGPGLSLLRAHLLFACLVCLS